MKRRNFDIAASLIVALIALAAVAFFAIVVITGVDPAVARN